MAPVLAALLVLLAVVGSAGAEVRGEAGAPPAAQILCILDFIRLGDDASVDWLQRGLADMMISTMSRHPLYRVIERRQLRNILREHGLAAGGLVDMDTAVRGGRLAKADLLLMGSFARQGDRLTVQTRVIRLADQQVVAQTVWSDRHVNVLAAPRTLSEGLLARLAKRATPAPLAGLEEAIPRTIDVAKAYYAGMEAFDDGRYPEALAHYLDAARDAGDFVKAYPAALEMYDLLGQGEHAVLFARTLARRFEAGGDVTSAAQYYFAAAQRCLEPLDNHPRAIEQLEQLLRLLARHEAGTGTIAGTKRFILDRITELHGTGRYDSFGKILADPSIRDRLGSGDIDTQQRHGSSEQAGGGRSSLLTWKIRAQRALARAHARLGSIERALDGYRDLIGEYAFLDGHPLSDGRQRDPIRAEAHFMLLHHHARTGQLIRSHAVNAINRLNVVENRRVFRRDFVDLRPDARARVTSRFTDRGHEYFDFAAPPNHQIDAVTLQASVAGIATFRVDLPHPVGWPPRSSFSRRLMELRYAERGRYERTIPLPRGTELFSIGTSWGPDLFSTTPAEVLSHQRSRPADGRDIVWWQASFVVSRKASAAPTTASEALRGRHGLTSGLIARHAIGWESAVAIRPPETVPYAGQPALDVYAEDWLVYAIEGDIQIFNRRDPQLRVGLPVTINTRDGELDPSLVRTHDGRYALLWARGTGRRSAGRFVAFSSDLLRWETPQRLVFEEPRGAIGYTYAQLEPLERTTHVVPIPRGYAMLLAQGFIRYSDDLRTWGPPQKVLPQDLHKNRLVKTRDGTLWAVYETSSNERQPYTPDDWLHGHFVVDGKPYRHVTEVRASRSVDGRHWHEAGKVVLPGQPTGLWAFPLADRRIGIAVGFNNRFVSWLAASAAGDLRRIDAGLQIQDHGEAAELFVRDASLTCVRPVFDVETQGPMLLATSSRALLARLAE